MHSHNLPLIAQRFLNQPLCMHPSRAPMLIAALNQRIGVNAIQYGENEYGREEMAMLADAGRHEAGVRQARRVSGKTFQETEGVAIIPVEGTLANSYGLDPESGFTGYDGIETKILDAENDPSIRAKALVIDSGGGDVAGLFDLAELIWSLNAKNGGKPTYAICADHAYSAAYALATAADKVWVPRTGGVGSVGVITLHADYSEQLKSNGIKVTVIRAGEEKFRSHPAEPLPEHTLAHIQGQIDDIREIFIETVARNMGVSKKSVRETEALDYMGLQAKAIGFVSDVGSKHQAWGSIIQSISR